MESRPLLPEWEQLFAAGRRGDAVLIGGVGPGVVAALGGSRHAVHRHRPRQRPAGWPGPAGAGAPRPVPGPDRAGSPSRQLLGRAVRAARTRDCRRARDASGARPQRRVARAAAGRRANGLRDRTRRAVRRAAAAHAAPHPLSRNRATGHFRGVPRRTAAQAPEGPAQAPAPPRRRAARAARRHAARRSECDDRPLAGHPGALVAAPRQAHGPRARKHPVSRLHARARGPDGAARVGPGVGAAPRRRGGGGRGEPHRPARLLLLDGRIRPGRRRISASASSQSAKASGRASRQGASTTT